MLEKQLVLILLSVSLTTLTVVAKETPEEAAEQEKFRASIDGGMTWKLHALGVQRPAGRSFGLSIVGDEFWVTGQTSKASRDGIKWRDPPATIPSGRVATSDKGTLINGSKQRHSILRSDDCGQTRQQVYTFSPDPNATGGARGFADVEFGYVRANTKNREDETS